MKSKGSQVGPGHECHAHLCKNSSKSECWPSQEIKKRLTQGANRDIKSRKNFSRSDTFRVLNRAWCGERQRINSKRGRSQCPRTRPLFQRIWWSQSSKFYASAQRDWKQFLPKKYAPLIFCFLRGDVICPPAATLPIIPAYRHIKPKGRRGMTSCSAGRSAGSPTSDLFHL